MIALISTPWPDVPTLLGPAMGETVRLVGLVMAVVVALGLPLGLLIFNTSPLGLTPHRVLHVSVSWVSNLGRSLPFLVLMAAVIPVTKLLFGTTIGFKAALLPMTIAGVAFFARITENAVREVPRELLDVGLAGGSTRWQIVTGIQLKEALPGLVAGFTINLVAMIEYSAIAGAIGSGGVGYLAVNYGYRRFDEHIMLACIALLVVLVQAIQFSGDRAVRALTR